MICRILGRQPVQERREQGQPQGEPEVEPLTRKQEGRKFDLSFM